MKNIITVGIFDSGVGGISIGEVVYTKIPYVSVCYCCDNLNYPYGEKSSQNLQELALKSIERFLNKEKIDILVIACNTASTLILPQLRATYSIPIVGVVPAIKPAAQISQSKIIGLLATPATINRNYVNDLITKFASDCVVIKVGSSKLVELAEQKLRGKKIPINIVQNEIKNFFIPQGTKKTDTIVLGCTHFPLLIDELKQASAWNVNFLDSSEAIAKRVENIINNYYADKIMISVNDYNLTPRTKKIFFTKNETSLIDLWNNFLSKNNFSNYEILENKE